MCSLEFTKHEQVLGFDSQHHKKINKIIQTLYYYGCDFKVYLNFLNPKVLVGHNLVLK